MNSLQILHCLRGIENHTTGVYPADRIPKVLTKPIAIVVNTDGHKLPGAHWVAMYVDRSGHGWFFDSYGLPPIVPDHLIRLRRNCRLFEYNATQLQGPNSQCCGHYCVMFLHYMCTGLGLCKFKSEFSSNLELNDKIVYDYYRAYINNNKKNSLFRVIIIPALQLGEITIRKNVFLEIDICIAYSHAVLVAVVCKNIM